MTEDMLADVVISMVEAKESVLMLMVAVVAILITTEMSSMV